MRGKKKKTFKTQGDPFCIAMGDFNKYVLCLSSRVQRWGSLLTRTKHENYRTHWGTERFMITSILKSFQRTN